MSEQANPGNSGTVSGLVPMIHVTEVERSAEFYRWFGFEIGHRVPRVGPMSWAWLYSPQCENWKKGPNLMLARSEEATGGKARMGLFYLYTPNLAELREKLLAQGFGPGEIEYPDYLPKGEFGIQDPDGYRLMVAQSTDDTP